MQRAKSRFIRTIISCSFIFVQVYGSFNDVTSKIGISSEDGIIAAFGDFNGDKSTDLFIISNQGKQLDIWTWDEGKLKFSLFRSFKFTDRYIINVAPGDFNGDGCLDVTITTQDKSINTSDVLPKTVLISWGNKNQLTNMKDSFVINNLKDQPSILDVNGDLLPDLFGTTFASNVSSEERTYWIAAKNNSFTAQRQTSNVTGKHGKVENSPLSPVTIPNSNAFLDLTGDTTADLFVTAKDKFEIWKNQDGVLIHIGDDVPLPHGHVHIGQTTFDDFDGDGSIDHLLPVCLTPNCEDSRIYIYTKNKWSTIMTNKAKTWQFVPPTKSDYYPYVPSMAIKVGDYNMDGYPDGLMIVNVTTPSGLVLKRIPVLLENTACSDGNNCVNGRTFEIQWKPMTSLQNAIVATFFDLYENGITDFIIVTETKGKFHLHAIRNDLYVDASFLKIMVLSGSTLSSCSGETLPYGVNQAGPYVKYTITDKDGKLKTGAAGQLSQSSYFSLQPPYIVFGLGRTPNFVDSLTIGMPRSQKSPERSHTWPQIIPNSQMIIVPYPPDEPMQWKSKLLVTPSKLVLLTALCLLGLCVLLAIVIVALHLIEKRADQKEKREDAHKFHFDAM